MKIENSVAFVSGGGRGIGKAIANALLAKGASKVYVTAREAAKIKVDDSRIVPISMDITKPETVLTALELASDVNLLINNAGINSTGSILDEDISGVYRDMDTNYYGTVNIIRQFYKTIENNGGGNIVNILSICSFANMPALAGYCASKAALHSITQAFRVELAKKSIVVQGVFPGPVDTDMNEGLEIEMASPESVADEVVSAITNDTADTYPDPVSKKMYQDWMENPESIEKQFAEIV